MPPNFTVTPEFVDYLRTVENADNTGYDQQTGLWFPHDSPEGNQRGKTIGWGHLIDPGEAQYFNQGVSTQEILKVLEKDIYDHAAIAEQVIDRKHGKTTFASMPQDRKEMAVDFAIQLGPSFAAKFPKFTQALVAGDMKTAAQEYIRKYTDPKTGKLVEAKDRNERFRQRYLDKYLQKKSPSPSSGKRRFLPARP